MTLYLPRDICTILEEFISDGTDQFHFAIVAPQMFSELWGRDVWHIKTTLRWALWAECIPAFIYSDSTLEIELDGYRTTFTQEIHSTNITLINKSAPFATVYGLKNLICCGLTIGPDILAERSVLDISYLSCDYKPNYKRIHTTQSIQYIDYNYFICFCRQHYEQLSWPVKDMLRLIDMDYDKHTLQCGCVEYIWRGWPP